MPLQVKADPELFLESNGCCMWCAAATGTPRALPAGVGGGGGGGVYVISEVYPDFSLQGELKRYVTC